MILRTLLLSLPLVLSACGDTYEEEDDKPIRDGGGGSGTGSGSGGEEGGDEGNEGGEEGGEEEGGEDGSTTFRPRGGTWTYTGGTVISDPCDAKGLAEDGGGGGAGDGNFDLSNTGDGSFTMKAEGGDPFRCTLTEFDYTCEQLTSIDPIDDYDVVLHSTLDHSGTFESDEAHTADFNLLIECEGGDCELAEWFYDLDFPCTVVFDATATFVSE